MKVKYFDRTQALIVFYAVQQAVDTGAKYIYMTDDSTIYSYKEPMHPKDVELSKSELVLVLPKTEQSRFNVDPEKVIKSNPEIRKE